MLVHSSQRFSGEPAFIFSLGRFGVQLFFVVSAYTMCMMWDARADEKHRIAAFFSRRILRIAPLFWLAIPVYLLLSPPASFGFWESDGKGIGQILGTALFLHCFLPDAINTVVPGGWSISVEMTFYLAFPLLMLVNLKPSGLLWLGMAAFFLNAAVFTPTALRAAGHLEAVGLRPEVPRDFVYLSFLNNAHVFVLGCFVYAQVKHRMRPPLVLLAAWMALAVAASPLYADARHVGFLAVTLLLYALVYAVQRLEVHSRPLDELGRHSYAIYLSHFLVLAVLPATLPLPLGLLVTVVLSYSAARVIHVLIERPLATRGQAWIKNHLG